MLSLLSVQKFEHEDSGGADNACYRQPLDTVWLNCTQTRRAVTLMGITHLAMGYFTKDGLGMAVILEFQQVIERIFQEEGAML